MNYSFCDVQKFVVSKQFPCHELILENVFKMLTGQKFQTFFLGFLLSSGATRAVFAKSGKIFCSILELIDLVESGVKKSTATFISLGGMVSILVVFLELSFFLYRHIMKMGRNVLFAIY